MENVRFSSRRTQTFSGYSTLLVFETVIYDAAVSLSMCDNSQCYNLYIFYCINFVSYFFKRSAIIYVFFLSYICRFSVFVTCKILTVSIQITNHICCFINLNSLNTALVVINFTSSFMAAGETISSFSRSKKSFFISIF